MFLDSIEYVASLIKAAASACGLSIHDTALRIGREQISDLCHNAPMNQLLPARKIVGEIIQDYDLPYGVWEGDELDVEFGAMIRAMVFAMVSDQREYPNALFTALCQ